jgi:hypothetical protein
MSAGTPSRAYDPSSYPIEFTRIVVQFENLLLRHRGTKGAVERFDYEIQLNYIFKTESDKDLPVSLCICHRENYVFSAHHFQGAGAKPDLFCELRREASELGAKLLPPKPKKSSRKKSSRKKSSQKKSSPFTKDNVVSAIRTVLEDVDCTEVDVVSQNYGYKFLGSYKSSPFVFVVYHPEHGSPSFVWEKPTGGLVELCGEFEKAERRILAEQKAGKGELPGPDLATTPDIEPEPATADRILSSFASMRVS